MMTNYNLPTRAQIEAVIVANAGQGKEAITEAVKQYLINEFSTMDAEEAQRIVNDLGSYYQFTQEQ